MAGASMPSSSLDIAPLSEYWLASGWCLFQISLSHVPSHGWQSHIWGCYQSKDKWYCVEWMNEWMNAWMHEQTHCIMPDLKTLVRNNRSFPLTEHPKTAENRKFRPKAASAGRSCPQNRVDEKWEHSAWVKFWKRAVLNHCLKLQLEAMIGSHQEEH